MSNRAHSIPSRLRRGSSRVLLALMVATLGVSTLARSEGVRACPAIHSAEDALRLLNEARARGAICHRTGEVSVAAPVQWSDNLAAIALSQAREQALLNRMGHRDSQNRGLGERLRALGYRFSSAVENVGVGYPALDDVIDAWLKSEGHCENLMNAAVLELGVACIDGGPASAPEEGRYWALVLSAPPRRR